MVSEEQIEAGMRGWIDAITNAPENEGVHERRRRLVVAILTAAKQAEPAPAQCKHPVWGQDKDGTRVCAKCGLVEHPAARSGAVKVKALEWESIDGGNAFRAPALIFGWIRIETYTLHSWQVQWSVPGICNLLMPNVFDSPSAAKAAAQADYERRILSALEPAEPEVMCVGCEGKPSLGNSPCAVCGKQAAEPATDAEPWTREKLHRNDAAWAMFYRDGKTMGEIAKHFGVSIYALSPWLTAPLTRPPEPEGNAQPWGYWVKHKYSDGALLRKPAYIPKADANTTVIPLFTRPPESRLREALEGLLAPFSDDPCRLDHHGYCQAHFLELHCCVAKARAALAQEDGR